MFFVGALMVTMFVEHEVSGGSMIVVHVGSTKGRCERQKVDATLLC